MSGQPTDEQVRAGADALVRLRTQAPSLAELADEDQEFWLADARAVLEAAGPRPSQGHGIPTDQLAAYVRWADREAGLSNDDPVEQVAKAAYAVGFAAALGHRITVAPDGCGLHIGDRVNVEVPGA